MSRTDVLRILRREQQKASARFGVRRLALFGSVARDEARVDLVTASGLKPRARPLVEREAIDVA